MLKTHSLRNGLLLFVFSTTTIYGETANWCLEKGGWQLPSGECRCLDRKEPLKLGERCSIVAEAQFCNNPGPFLCQNESSEQEIEAAERADAMRRKAREDARVQALVAKWPEDKRQAFNDGRWGELADKEREAVLRQMGRALSDQMFTEERTTKLTQLFERAKTDTLTQLENRLAQEQRPAARKTLEQMQEQIRKVTYAPDLDSTAEDGLLPHNMTAHTDHFGIPVRVPGVKTSWTRHQIRVGSMILAVDTSPESLYFTLLHEFAHFIDGRIFPVVPGKEQEHPFYLERLCLQQADSIGAKKNQIDEAFADWHGMQVWTAQNQQLLQKFPGRYQDNSHLQDQYDDPSQPGKKISAIQTDRWSPELKGKLEQVTAMVCADYRAFERDCRLNRNSNQDCHPLSLDRVNANLSSPQIRYALGCSDKNRLVIQRPLSKPLTKGVLAHCGPALYQAQVTNPVQQIRRRWWQNLPFRRRRP